ncbi:cytochrome P450/oxidoreductase [Burkholderia pseudomallei]|uniref:cytochrome P450/oxidoreductase n=1 Tax=Burkholderia pseudomallei TaxID=28450 RepID=UPI000F08C178|nr:cytochrome P450/oxidoreductase [Burkholderia pseudomallei]MBF3556019.1 cytochrome P450/oxidoreductase [Burkholderia pseudomallei]MBO3040256.1 cytochrome P450/oxidoreductase [Burkholderia pseudomallei]MDY7819750.1 cytochrome P450/oxidoreductase [Burkholderia pseudomallei]MDY7866231.1 cytochrome P450/oxidoreductase [Burkholderia pseudomallei]VCN39290.1 cytochrome P450 [Burkholderia pseudomallei]
MTTHSASTPPALPAAQCPFRPVSDDAAAHPAGCPASAGAAAFDPFDDAYQQDPPEYVRWAREREPVFYSPKLGYWVVARYDDIKTIFRDNRTFSPSIALEKITPTGPDANAALASYGYAMGRTLVNEDEPAHMARRRLLIEPFTPDALRAHEPMVRRLAREYVDRFVDDGRADLVDQMLWEVPLTVALHFLGVPEADMDTLRAYSIAHTVNTWGRPRPDEQVAVAHAVGQFWQYAGKVLGKMREDPSGPGWMQFGIRMQREHPDIVTDSYLHSMMMAGIVAAHETTANATANALKLLLEHPRAWRELCDDPALIPNAVDECLRHSGSIVAWRRIATRDATVGGVAIPAGAKLLIVTSSANRDERRFADPDLFDIHRDNPADHLTFGYGSHQCMGKHLARMEMQIFIDELSRRLPHMRLAEQRFTYVPNTSFRGPEHLWVEWAPAENPQRRGHGARRCALAVRIDESNARRAGRALRVDSVMPVAERVLRVRLVAPDGAPLPRWSAGAHIDVECGDTGLSRQYSLCGDPAERGVYEIAVLREPASRGGSAWLHERLRPGMRVKIRGPRNHFRLDGHAARAILIAGGIGITPIGAIAREARARGIDYALHYCGRSRRTMAFVDELAALHGERLRLHVSDEGTRHDFSALDVAAGTQVYACGPARMLDALAACAAHWPAHALRVEHFAAAAPRVDPRTDQPFEVELKDSGLTLTVPANRTLLATLRAANVDVQSDCEEGLCGSCEVRVLAGEVDHRDSVLSADERALNTRMMACCSRARHGRLVLEL